MNDKLWHEHREMIKLAQDHGLHLAANWAVNMSGKTFSEAKEKPTAPKEATAGLVEGLLKLGRKERDMLTNPACAWRDEDKVRYGEIRGIYRMEKAIEEYLSRYRPSPQADIVGELRECILKHYLRTPSCFTDFMGDIEEIIRKHEGAK